MTNQAIGRTELAILTNKSGGAVAQGDVVIIDTANASAFTTTTSAAYVSGRIGVIWEPNGIASNGSGLVAFSGYIPIINLSGTGSIGDMIATHTVAKQGARHVAPQAAGDFAQVLGTTATPAALLFGTVQLGGGSASRTLITSSSPSGTGTVSFTGIPGTYHSLEIEFVARSTKAASGNEPLKMEFNTDTTATNYRNTYDQGFGGSPGTASVTGADTQEIAALPAASAPSNAPAAGIIQIPRYADTTFNKVGFSNFGYRFDSSSIQMVTGNQAMEWESTVAITRVDLKLASGNFVAGSIFRLYGIS